jgi:uncharacterized membrane protein
MWSVRRLWLVLVTLAVAGCLASLFAPAERWLGVDLGAIGASLLYLALLGSVLVTALRPRQVFPEDWSLAEARAWVGLVFTGMILLGFGKFLWVLAQLEEVPRKPWGVPAGHFLFLLVTLFIAWSLISGLLARGAGPVEQDERDLRLRNQADRAGDLTLTFIVIGFVVVLINGPAVLGWWLEPMVLANTLLGVLIVKAMVEFVALVTSYAQGRR